ncbi:hypothetical protein AA12717_2742 [Gluconacetobacter sacchari DSM 12717]|uniref:Uncharacterized protein n=2 Tax=Gluconacetobacter sacchari TaxID=92759 RepID=A0A7W4ICG1_9PROT|nr:hypothetical protein [Gluconacetobacter sacchari]MBB2160313.1 hypothetical protein [Gluconacetobacter sacchari]GBQ27664.1 hypothetical protein AA12717_2742 [Gluconacetobacter sacchari DSM 12717]
MNETIGCDAWHLTHSQPSLLVDYFDPGRGFPGQINSLVSRFQAVQAMCVAGEGSFSLTELRNELAFHLIRMSRWWLVDFCPPGLTGVRAPLFMSYVKAHAARSVEDEALLDLFTVQQHMRAGDPGHIMVLGRESDGGGARSIVYGLDGRKAFRFTTRATGAVIDWSRQAYPDFAGAWLGARAYHCPAETVRVDLREHLAAEREHGWARIWHRRHFHRASENTLVRHYLDAMSRLVACQSRFGRAEFESIVNAVAFKMVRQAVERRIPLAGLLEEDGSRDMSRRVADCIRQRAFRYVGQSIDSLQRPKLEALIARSGP